MSDIYFTGKNSLICYIAINRFKASEAISSQSIPVRSMAYEYPDLVPLGSDDVVLAIEIDLSNMLDTTYTPDYNKYMVGILNKTVFSKEVPVIRKVMMKARTQQFKIAYIILDNSCIIKVHRVCSYQ